MTEEKRTRARILIEEFLSLIDERLNEDEIKETAQFVIQMIEEVFYGVGKDPASFLKKYRVENVEEMVALLNIPFYSICKHHLLPFFGKVHIVYIPKDNQVAGVGDVVKFIKVASRKLHLQETLAQEIAEAFEKAISPRGVFVLIEARHLCVEMRGEEKQCMLITSASRGIMEDKEFKKHALEFIRHNAIS